MAMSPLLSRPRARHWPVTLFTTLFLALTLLLPQLSVAATPCGGNGQRACCVTERPPGTSCDPGFREVPGCIGDCKCGGANPFDALNSIGHCEPLIPPAPAAVPCGGPGQRACCVTERVPSCNNGLHEVLGCSGNCVCGGPNPAGALKSIGHCEANPVISPCGGPGQRACCVTERVPSCNNGFHEEPGCTGPNCTCGGTNPGWTLKSIGHCVANPTITPCGGPGQRACCVTERVPSCNNGLHEEPGCTGPNCTCGGPNPAGALKSIGHCVANPPPVAATPCGGPGQRACCVTERVPSCNNGLFEVLGCNGDCRCGGANPLGALNSVGHCEANCETARAQLQAELVKAKAEIETLKQRCGQAGSVAPTGGTPPPPSQYPPPQIKQQPLQQPLIKQAPRQLLR